MPAHSEKGWCIYVYYKTCFQVNLKLWSTLIAVVIVAGAFKAAHKASLLLSDLSQGVHIFLADDTVLFTVVVHFFILNPEVRQKMVWILFAPALLQRVTVASLNLKVHELAACLILRLAHNKCRSVVGVFNENPEFCEVTCSQCGVMRGLLHFASLNDEQVCAN